jgi:hypothetical protein
MTNCKTCKEEIELILSDLPSLWRAKISESICKVFDDFNKNRCEAIEECETVTFFSEFKRNGSEICVTYMDEDEISYERCFDFENIINSLLDNLDPKCLAPISVWKNLSFSDRIQLMINTACNIPSNTIFTTTSTTTSTSTSTSTTTSSTTTTTTEVPVCGCFSIQNLTPSVYPAFYNACTALNIPLNLNPGEKKYVCSTFQGITQTIDEVIETLFLGDCSVCAQFNTTTTTSTTTVTSSSTTTTTTLCDPYNYICVTINAQSLFDDTINQTFNTATQPFAIISGNPFYNNINFRVEATSSNLTGFVNNFFIIKNDLTNCWELYNPYSNTVIATHCSDSIYGIWTPIDPTINSITVSEADQFLQCIGIPATTTSSTTTTTTEDPCNVPANPGGITSFTTTTTVFQPCDAGPCYRWNVNITDIGGYVEYTNCNGGNETKTTNGVICVCGIPCGHGADVQIITPVEVCTNN